MTHHACHDWQSEWLLAGMQGVFPEQGVVPGLGLRSSARGVAVSGCCSCCFCTKCETAGGGEASPGPCCQMTVPHIAPILGEYHLRPQPKPVSERPDGRCLRVRSSLSHALRPHQPFCNIKVKRILEFDQTC